MRPFSWPNPPLPVSEGNHRHQSLYSVGHSLIKRKNIFIHWFIKLKRWRKVQVCDQFFLRIWYGTSLDITSSMWCNPDTCYLPDCTDFLFCQVCKLVKIHLKWFQAGRCSESKGRPKVTSKTDGADAQVVGVSANQAPWGVFAADNQNGCFYIPMSVYTS